MAQFLPLFPLSLVVYPGEPLRLHIFEPRYKELIGECIENKTTFGIPAVVDREVMDIATEVKIAKVDKKYDDGKLDITTVGVRRVRVVDYYEKASGKLYPGGQVEWLDEEKRTHAPTREKIFHLLKELHQILGIKKDFHGNPEEISAYRIGHLIGLSLDQEYQLLTLTNEKDRLFFIHRHLKSFLPVVLEAERLKSKAKLNGHFKIIVPPEDI